MSILKALQVRLAAAGITTNVELGRVPAKPDAVIALLERPANRSRDLNATNLPALETLRVQVVARAGKDAGIGAAEAIAHAAYRALVGRHLSIVVGTDDPQVLDWVIAEHVPAHTGYDANDRPLVSTTLSIQRHGTLS